MSQIIDIRNNTTEDIIVKDLGITVPANIDDNDINVLRLTDLASLDNISFSKDFRVLLQSGNISVNGRNGTGDGTAATNIPLTDAEDEVNVATIVNTKPNIEYAESSVESSTTGTDYIQHLGLNFDSDTDEYLVQWFSEVKSSHNSAQVKIKIEIDGAITIEETDWNPNSGIFILNDAGFIPVSGFRKIQLTAGNHNLDFNFASSKVGRTIAVRNTKLSITKL